MKKRKEAEKFLSSLLQSKHKYLCDWTVKLIDNSPTGLEHYTRDSHVLNHDKVITIPSKWDMFRIIETLNVQAGHAIEKMLSDAYGYDSYLNSQEHKLISLIESMRGVRPNKLNQILNQN